MKTNDIIDVGIAAQGREELMKFNSGTELTRNDAIKAKCYECNLGYIDGREDCGVLACPLHGYMPYNPNKYPPRISEESRNKRSKAMRKQWEDKMFTSP